jgi:hypothetical protein
MPAALPERLRIAVAMADTTWCNNGTGRYGGQVCGAADDGRQIGRVDRRRAAAYIASKGHARIAAVLAVNGG